MAISQLKAKFARTKNDAEDDSESNSNSASGSRGSSTAMSADPKRVEDLSGQIEAIRRSQCVATFSMDGTILDANDVFLNAMGYSLAEVKGKHHSMFVTPDYASSREYAQFWERLRNNEFHAAEFKRIGKVRPSCTRDRAHTHAPILSSSRAVPISGRHYLPYIGRKGSVAAGDLQPHPRRQQQALQGGQVCHR